MSTATQDRAAAEVAREQAHVDRVYEELAKAAARAELVHAEGMSRGQTDRRGTGDPRDEELSGLFERDALVHSASRRRQSLQHEHEGLVFGRLDLGHDGSGPSTREVRYVGRLGVRDDDYEPLVIDWRAPAAAPFYQATPTRPLGVLRRRVLRCRGEQVVGVEDDLMVPEAPEDMVVLGDGALMAALTRSRGQQMRDIVATIQQHQDQAIRAPARGVTEITGGPGTGKTVVALHRAAYLLYSDRRRYESGGVLVVGPSAAYTSYIERVLPSLGEESVTLRSLGGLVPAAVGSRHDEPAAAAAKGSLRMLRVLDRLVRRPPPDAPTELRVFVQGHAVRLDAAALDRVSARVRRHHQRNGSLEAAVQALADEAWAQVGQEAQGERREREEFVDVFADSRDVAAFAHRWWRPLDPREVLLWLADEQVAAEVAAGVLDTEEVGHLIASMRRALELGTWSIADVALVDEVVARIGPVQDLPQEERGFYEIEELDDVSQYGVSALRVGRDGANGESAGGAGAAPVSVGSHRLSRDPRERLLTGRVAAAEEYAHVLVDEAQDLSPMQWRMVGRRGRSASWTVVGDAAQSSWPGAAEALRAREEAFGSAPRRTFHMDTNYRNAREIFDHAARLIRAHVPDADIPRAVRETGVDPVEHVSADLLATTREALAQVAGEVEGSLAVITPERHRAALAGVAGAHEGRTVLVAPLSSKGLEWDATVVVDPEGIVAESPGGPRVLYVALTRAAHRMHVVRVS